ncbi:hypothetical protein GTA08_BOTSDO04351 [Botryosphaeria dothidea]|uniref:Uncharacterized protein n=1 Tax=Botryosphaeria dothidea TaxID=55169 RepID=A0A8H4N597_9PEZI|nr:hypothetical protein GTA08_BOTSDO04351 [Botryosphaeria dothidea]
MASLGRRLSKRLSMLSSKRRSTATESVVSYSSLSTTLSEVPAENNESFDKDLWIAAQMYRKDSRLDLPRGGLPKPDADWYDSLDEDPTKWGPEVFYQGFDITIRDYLQAEAELVELLHDTDADGVPWCTKEWTYTISVRTRYIYDQLRQKYEWLSEEAAAERQLPPSWFVEDGLAGWMERTACEMRENPEFCKYARKEPRQWVTRCRDERIDSFHADDDEKQAAQHGIHQQYDDDEKQHEL